MEYRKLISFGKNSFVVSLPKTWVVQNKLKKGDLVYLEEAGGSLVLAGKSRGEEEEKTKQILVDGRSIRRIQREIISSYIKNYRTIILMGDEIKDKAEEIQDTIQNLMALEVLEQTSKKIVAKDFLDMNTISIQNIIRKIDVILRAMIEDCEKMFVEDNYENISHRDNDVNRLTFLIFRVVHYGLENSTQMYKRQNLNSKNLLNLWWFAFNLETIGDEVKRIARYMAKTTVDKKQRERFLTLLSKTREQYLQVMKAFHTQDIELAHSVLESKDKIISDCEEFYHANQKHEYAGLLSERLKALLTNVHNISRVTYNHEFTQE